MRYRYAFLLLAAFFTVVLPSYSFADGLAMHGQAKYGADAQHLSYVNPDAPKGGALKSAAIGTYDSLNPYSIKGQAAQHMGLVYDRLMRRVWDEPFTLYPLIAERIEVPEDRSSITFHINPKARFHDGSAISAADVLFSYETLKTHGRPNMRNIYKLVERAEIIDPLKIRFSLGAGYDRESVMILAMMPVLSKAWWQDRDFDSSLSAPPLLNGPYRIKDYALGKHITYERVDEYWARDLFVNRGQYNFDEITYDYYRDDTIALESFKKGDLNLRREWDVSKWQSAYADLRDDFVQRSLQHKRPERAHGLVFNMRRAPFNDVRVRQALSLAFDADWVGKNLYHASFKRIHSYYPNSVLDGSKTISEQAQALLQDYKDDLQSVVFDADFSAASDAAPYRSRLREAAGLLDQAGWIIQDGKRVHKDTKAALSFELIIATPQDQKIALAFQQGLKRLGVHMDIRMLDSATFQKRKTDYDYDMIAFYWQNSLSPGTEQLLYWSCKAADEPARFNYSGICNPALDHFAGAIANAQSYGALRDYAHIIDRILLSEYISIPLFYKGADYIAHSRSIQSPEVTPIYGAVLESWWMGDIGK